MSQSKSFSACGPSDPAYNRSINLVGSPDLPANSPPILPLEILRPNIVLPGPGEPADAGTFLVAGPASASPPLLIALALVVLSITGPFIFLADGTPSLLLGCTALAVALAGGLTMIAAIRAQIRRRADFATRRRVSITRTGITLHPTRAEADNLHFAWDSIDNTHLMPAAFILHANAAAPNPGRYAVRFGKLITPRAVIDAALASRAGQVQEPI